MKKVSIGVNVSEENGANYQSERYELDVPIGVSTGEILAVVYGKLRTWEADIEKEIRDEI